MQNEELTKKQVKAIFNFGMMYQFAISNPGKYHGIFPTDNLEDALDYVYKFVVENERDKECLRCKRFYSGSCDGTIDRKRESITDSNRCSGYLKKDFLEVINQKLKDGEKICPDDLFLLIVIGGNYENIRFNFLNSNNKIKAVYAIAPGQKEKIEHHFFNIMLYNIDKNIIDFPIIQIRELVSWINRGIVTVTEEKGE